jgi:hypothetical protein
MIRCRGRTLIFRNRGDEVRRDRDSFPVPVVHVGGGLEFCSIHNIQRNHERHVSR